MSSAAGKKWTPERIVRICRWCGVVITLLGLMWVVDTAWFLARAEQTDGTVVGWEAVKSKTRESNGFTSSHTYWHAMVELRDGFGVLHRARSPRALNQRAWEEGAEVPVYYDAEDPSQIFIRDAGSIWFPPGIIVALGTFVLLLSHFILLVLGLNAQRKAEDVADIVARHITQKKPGAASGGAEYVAFSEPPETTFSHPAYCAAGAGDSALAEELEKLGTKTLMLMGVEAGQVVLQTHAGVRRVPQAEIREVSVYPVLPAKACGHVQIQLELGAKGSNSYTEIFMTGPHSQSVQDWSVDKAAQVARVLGVPMTLLEPGHDC